MDERTITVTNDLTYAVPVIKMVWNAQIREEDVGYAFNQILDLGSKLQDFYVIVDLREMPRMPAPTVVKSVLGGAYQNPTLKEWLVIGLTEEARFVENTVWGMTGRHNVRWFDSEDAVRGYLNAQPT